jgi:very-short-patch-repair endonuclease
VTIYIPNPPALLPDDLRIWAREMRSGMTDAESLMWKILRSRRLADAKFRRQHPIGRYILDFYCHDRRLCIERDGSQHMESADYDQQRDSWLIERGIKVLRFWNNQVLAETESVMQVIYHELVLASPLTPDPSPACGRGE